MSERYTDLMLTVREVNALLHACGRGGVRDNACLKKTLDKFERFNGMAFGHEVIRHCVDASAALDSAEARLLGSDGADEVRIGRGQVSLF